MGIFDIVKSAISPITNVVDKLVKDKDLAKKLDMQLRERLIDSFTTTLESKRDIIVAEASGESWLQRNWRPVLMLSFTAIIVNNYILSPYLQALFGFSVRLEIPSNMWDLLKLGISGYIAGRSAEKGIKAWKGGKS